VRQIVILFLACLWHMPAFAAGPAGTPAMAAEPAGAGFLQVRGREIVESSGAVFRVRGIGLGNWLVPEGYMFKFRSARAPRDIHRIIEIALGAEEAAKFWETFRDRYITQDDIEFIAGSGFNTIRVPLHFGLFMAEPEKGGEARFTGPGWALLDRVIGWSRKAGLKVILDLHAAPGGQTGVNHDDGTGFPLVFYVERERRRTTAFWREIARRYRDEPAVLGYELLNEPISTYNDEDRLNPRLEPFYRQLVTAIRAVDPHHIIILAGAQWDQNFHVFGPPFAANLVYTYHKFWSATRRDAVHDYIAFAHRHRVPILLGEAGEATDAWNEGFRTLNEKHGFGWSFWTYKNLSTPSTVVSIPAPEGWEKIAALGSMAAPTLEKAGLTRDEARVILNAYLDAILFSKAEVRPCYLRSLGLAPALEAACRAQSAARRPAP
jgi:endoglucanase